MCTCTTTLTALLFEFTAQSGKIVNVPSGSTGNNTMLPGGWGGIKKRCVHSSVKLHLLCFFKFGPIDQ